jgi:hypothetical protein
VIDNPSCKKKTMSRMTYMQSWKSHRLTSHTWLGLNPQIGRPLSSIVVPLVYFFIYRIKNVLFFIFLMSFSLYLSFKLCKVNLFSIQSVHRKLVQTIFFQNVFFGALYIVYIFQISSLWVVRTKSLINSYKTFHP